uniref:Uncharacterized protein n=1 Tax=Attheya septentrionalis TaxID=420275 RepID=A0A7S2XLU2_9STRA|mmetsp:Transcript_17766/g.32149  ORF Transcript_17766/g.32149 Transcript_17766/m.32149 type:complete len:108 (+) Transcript_17766:85-408(+)|eukprot:CAMPEP_0198299784 /NCGR_PEP_ID=MMETSP1449-20131203/45774_1 /TAXON_ID=420275 /ORGANISM="Attheya septentrionalis, Strain CCMP2084" /LENGTH=107 /DNA_ID=CAMNT_0044001427 /DNA_START=52 /DNA_END=375 /DNA_ORIENTATION=+
MTSYNPMRLSQPQRIRLVQIFSARLVLEVFGGAGAIWGCSEAVGLRNATNVSFWRPLALTVGMIFFYRWVMQVRDYIKHQFEMHEKELQDLAETNSLVLEEYGSTVD